MQRITFERIFPKLMILLIATGSTHAAQVSVEGQKWKNQIEDRWRNILGASGWDITNLDWSTTLRYRSIFEDNSEYIITKDSAPHLIFQASEAGRLKLVAFLIAQGTDVFARDEYGRDIAHYIKCLPPRDLLARHGNEKTRTQVLELIKRLKDGKRAQETAQAQQEVAQAQQVIAVCGRSEAQSGEAAQVATIILAYLLPPEETDDI